MEIWIITDKSGKYICAFKNQGDAYKMCNDNQNRYNVLQQWLG